MNNLYISPEFEILRVEMLEDVLKGSLESGGGTIIGGDDWDSWDAPDSYSGGSELDEDW